MTNVSPKSVPRFRVWLVVSIVALFAAAALGPMAWQSYRERRRITEVLDNMDSLKKALEAYERSHPPQGSDDAAPPPVNR